MTNNSIQLTGFLGKEPKMITKNNKSFVVLSVGTIDSYPVKDDGDSVKWVSKETDWHDVIIFRPSVCEYASQLQKSDKVEIQGALSYRTFKDDKGYNRKQATIIADFVDAMEYSKQERSVAREIDELVEKLTAQ